MSELYVRGEPQPPKKTVNWKRILIPVAIAYVLILVICLIIVFWPEQKTYQYQGNVSTSSSKITTSSAKPNPIADWKTYTTSRLGFSVKYPKNWSYIKTSLTETESEPAGVTIAENNKEGAISIEIDNGSSLKGEYDFVVSQAISKPTSGLAGSIRTRLPNTTVGGSTGYVDKQQYSDTGKYKFKYILIVVVKRNGEYFEMLFDVPFGTNSETEFQNRKQVFDQIVSTFKFL